MEALIEEIQKAGYGISLGTQRINPLHWTAAIYQVNRKEFYPKDLGSYSCKLGKTPMEALQSAYDDIRIPLPASPKQLGLALDIKSILDELDL